MAIIFKIIRALAAAVPALLDWWARRKAAESRAEAEARVADIRREPGLEWVRKFNSRANPDGELSGAPGADEPKRDA